MIILNHFANLMALPEELALVEARNKFYSSFMIINDVLHKVMEIDMNSLVAHIIPKNTEHATSTIKYTGKDILSISAWLPDSGVYFIEKHFVFILKKIPKRQYKQSFSWDFYISSEGVRPEHIYYGTKINNNTYIFENKMFFLDIEIGKKTNNKWRCINNIFQYEFNINLLKEENNEYKI